MRPATSTSADGPMNLYQAVALACSTDAYDAGVLALFSDTIYSGRDLQKTNSYKTDAFKMGEFGSLGYMRDDQVYLLSEPHKNIPIRRYLQIYLLIFFLKLVFIMCTAIAILSF